jgi:hypothetical protein
MKKRDPIVEEVRKHREARAAKLGFNIRAIVQDARKRQATSGHRVTDLSQKIVTPPRKAKSKSLPRKGATSKA